MSRQTTTCIPCTLRELGRNAFFDGKLLTKRNLDIEQEYLVSKNRLHNQMLHGAGTACGLKIEPHPNESCRDKYLILTAGVALDCCGRDLIVPNKILLDVEKFIIDNELEGDAAGTHDLFISLCYEERFDEKIPVILPSCDCADGDQAYNLIKEGVSVKLALELPGERIPVDELLQPHLDWLHTLTLQEQSPRAVAVDDQLGQIYVAAQSVDSDGEATGRARVFAYDSQTHDLITAVSGGTQPTDLALSLLGDKIYVATGGLGEAEADTGIAVLREAEIRTDFEPAAYINLGEPARLIVSPHTGALFALLLTSGEVRSWPLDEIDFWLNQDDPDPAGPAGVRTRAIGVSFATNSPAMRGANILNISRNGLYLFVANSSGSDVRVVDVADFTDITPAGSLIPEEAGVPRFAGNPIVIATSQDSRYLFVLWAGAGTDDGFALLSRYRIDEVGGTFGLFHDGRIGRWAGTAHDFALSPRERLGYALQVDSDGQGQVQALLIDNIDSPSGEDPFDPSLARELVSGAVRAELLALAGGRLYVAADDAATEIQPARGLVAILDVEEEACLELFNRAIEGCPRCGDDDDTCVILAHIPGFVFGEPMVAEGETNIIDNLTYRPIVPSASNIAEVIRCLLDQGFAEGIPGPRGPAGETGSQGERGSGITETQATTLPGGSPATAVLEPITADPEGDQRLLIGVPAGAPGSDGADGARGPGITEVSVDTLPTGSAATAVLEPIAGDPEGDQILVLGIPRGADGADATDPDLTRISALSWQHGVQLSMAEFLELVVDTNIDDDTSPRTEGLGLVIMFSDSIQAERIFNLTTDPRELQLSEIFQLPVRFVDRNNLLCECLVAPAHFHPVEVVNDDAEATGRVTEIRPILGEASPRAVRMVFAPESVPGAFERTDENPLFVRIVLRADFVLDGQDTPLAVDGNFIGGTLPTGNGRQGDDFVSWLSAT